MKWRLSLPCLKLRGVIMGNKYQNLTVMNADREEIVRLLNQKKHRAFVAPSVNGFTVVWHDYLNSSGWNAETESYERNFNVGLDLSQELGSVVLEVLNFDDDILTYTLLDKGVEVDAYDSVNEAEYWGPHDEAEEAAADEYEQRTGDAVMLCHTFNAPQNSTAVGNLLNRAFTFEVERHQELADLLSLPLYAIGFDFTDIESDNLPEGLSKQDITRTGFTS